MSVHEGEGVIQVPMGGGGYPILSIWGFLIQPTGGSFTQLTDGVSQADQDRVFPIKNVQEYPSLELNGVPPPAVPPPRRQSSLASTCYVAGGMPPAFKPEDFLVATELSEFSDNI